MLRTLFILLISMISPLIFAAPNHYEPTQASVSQHPLPEWYDDAKFGIFIHYGLYSVPAWAELNDPTGKVFSPEFFAHNPYAAWYMNSIQLKDSAAYDYHVKTYGANYSYDNFLSTFNQEARQWQPEDWSALFEKAGAKYVVLTTKHHDGFLLWPSHYTNPYKPNYVADRDIVGEFTRSIRQHNMRVGLYYSGGYDWSWQEVALPPISDLSSALAKVPQTKAYAEYVTHHWKELIDTYHPDLLWNDIALPQAVDKETLFAHYYNTVPDGVVNNRWLQTGVDVSYLGQPEDAALDEQLKSTWYDYYSPEYLTKYVLTSHKWEADHAPGYDFSYNKYEYESPEHFFSLDQLIGDLADIVSKNGNLLLAIGPEADGTIPDIEKNLLLGIGEWLGRNGESIYGTRPWQVAEGSANQNAIPVRFTRSKNQASLYAILLKNPGNNTVSISHLFVRNKHTKIQILNGKMPILVNWHQENDGVAVELQNNKMIPDQHPIVVKITPQPVLIP